MKRSDFNERLFESLERDLRLLGINIIVKHMIKDKIYILFDVPENNRKDELHRYGISKYSNGVLEIISSKVLIGNDITVIEKEKGSIEVKLFNEGNKVCYTVNMIKGKARFHK